MAGPVETLSYVARRLIQFEQRFAQAREERKRNASYLFSQISQSIQLLVSDLGRDQLPHEACRDLIFCSTKLKGCAEAELGITETERLALALSEASDKEKIFLEFRTSDRKDYLSEELKKAAILIQALANGIFVPVPGRGSGPADPHPQGP
ncbi:MAG: hypothetical protein ABIW76_00690 [Fibrobacteria bacterium]